MFLLLLAGLAVLWAWQPLPFREHLIIISSGVGIGSLTVDESTGRLFVTGSEPVTAIRPPYETLTTLDSETGASLRTIHTTLGAGGAQCCQLSALVEMSVQGSDPTMVIDTRRHRGFVPVGCPTQRDDTPPLLPGWPARSAEVPPGSGCILMLDTTR